MCAAFSCPCVCALASLQNISFSHFDMDYQHIILFCFPVITFRTKSRVAITRAGWSRLVMHLAIFMAISETSTFSEVQKFKDLVFRSQHLVTSCVLLFSCPCVCALVPPPSLCVSLPPHACSALCVCAHASDFVFRYPHLVISCVLLFPVRVCARLPPTPVCARTCPSAEQIFLSF